MRPGHGERARYAAGCRCGACKKANADYMREWNSSQGECSFEGCGRVGHCRGWCKYHYEQWRRGEEQRPLRPYTRTDTILDLLETDGGWLTTSGIAMRLEVNERSLDRRLARLRENGLVRSRYVPLSGLEGRTEWAA